jgi:hypothetical protein
MGRGKGKAAKDDLATFLPISSLSRHVAYAERGDVHYAR